jgi:FAD/FMN-containing dehydrogenase
MSDINRPTFVLRLMHIIGKKHVLNEGDSIAPYLKEQRGIFESQCLVVIRPGTRGEVSECVRLCAKHDVSIVAMGGNTGLCGGAVAHKGQIILSTERLNKVRKVDTENNSITVEAGCILKNIQTAASAQHRLFPLSLGAEGSCQIGGNLSTNAGGINVLHYGNARDLCLGIEAVLPDGSIYSDLEGLRKDNTGYALKHLFIGAEGTLGIITAATLKLFPEPKESVTALIALPGLQAVIQLYNQMRETSSDRVTTFELIPQIAIELTARHFAEHPAPFEQAYPWLVLVTLHSTRIDENLSEQFTDALASALDQNLICDALIAQNMSQVRHFLALREKLVTAQRFEGMSISHDISVPISRIPEFITRCAAVVEKIAPGARPYPFGHVGDGNIHYNICQPEQVDGKTFLAKRPRLNNAVLDIVHELGGSFSAEHGVGILKRDLIHRYKGDVALETMRSIKRAIDPHNRMNPGKVLADETAHHVKKLQSDL